MMKNQKRKSKRAAAMVLAALMAVNGVDLSAVTAYAKENTEQSAASAERVMTITGFAELEEAVTQQLLSVGASGEEIVFPDTLNVTVSAAEEQGTNEGEETARTKNAVLTGITWEIDAAESDGEVFDSSEAYGGYCYVYTPVLPETDEDGNKVTL